MCSPFQQDELLNLHGFKYSELRNATVQQLSRMAFVCNLWDQVVHACRKQEEKRDCRSFRFGYGDDEGHQENHLVVDQIKAEPSTDSSNNIHEPAGAETLSLFAEEHQTSIKCHKKEIEDVIKYSNNMWGGGSDILEQMLQKQSLNDFPKDEDSIFQSFLGTINALDTGYHHRYSTRSNSEKSSQYGANHCWYN